MELRQQVKKLRNNIVNLKESNKNLEKEKSEASDKANKLSNKLRASNIRNEKLHDEVQKLKEVCIELPLIKA